MTTALKKLEALNLEICQSTGAGRGHETTEEQRKAYREEMYRRRNEVAAAVYAARNERRLSGAYSCPYVEGIAAMLEDVTHPR